MMKVPSFDTKLRVGVIHRVRVPNEDKDTLSFYAIKLTIFLGVLLMGLENLIRAHSCHRHPC